MPEGTSITDEEVNERRPAGQENNDEGKRDGFAKLEETLEGRVPKQPPLPHEELQYLNLIREIFQVGEKRPDRTGTGTRSIFAPKPIRFRLMKPSSSPGVPPKLIFPLLTTKRVYVKGVIEELLWFISGDTNGKTLADKGVKIWDGNGSREYLDSVGLSHREEGDLGPVYGFQWRHFGAEYKDCHTDYTGKGEDQLAKVIEQLKNNPYDRRIILSAWNPADLKKMALPPCHMFCQFYVSFANRSGAMAIASESEVNGDRPKGTLHCLMYQRSCDMGLGVPFNIASYALLTHMIAHVCEMVPGELTIQMGDCHVYNDHYKALQEQLSREPREFPEVEILKQKGCSIEGWKYDDFTVKGYKPHPLIKMEMSV